MDPFPEESSAFDADPVDSLPSAQDLIADADAIDAEAAPETEKPAEEPHEDASASTMPAVFLMGAPSDSNDAPAPLPDLVDASPLRFVVVSFDFFFFFEIMFLFVCVFCSF